MRLVILGGGGFRVPLVVGALAGDPTRLVDEVVLCDESADRLAAIAAVVAQRTAGAWAPALTTTTDVAAALEGADVVFSAIRVGGMAGRTRDERVALDLGVLGQETTGPGGIAYALRTIPVAVSIAELIAARAPGALVINFTNPAGMVTQAMRAVLGERVIGICDSPIGLGRRAARALGLSPESVDFGYAGLNHLGWLRSLTADGVDRLPELIASPELLLTTEEGRLFGPDWIADLGAIPNEYLFYYYFTREAIAGLASGQTRGEYLLTSQQRFYDAVAADPSSAAAQWEATRRAREETYLAEARDADEQRDETDLAGGGYEGVALELMAAVLGGRGTTQILNVRNGSTIPGLPADAIVEVPCRVDAGGPVPLPGPGLAGHLLGLTQQLKEVEETTIAAALGRSDRLARKAFAIHPLVDSVTVAQALLDGYAPFADRIDG